MPIYKYKSLEEAEKHLQKLQPSDPLELLSALQDMVYSLIPHGKIQRGVFKFKSIEEANKHREETTGY